MSLGNFRWFKAKVAKKPAANAAGADMEQAYALHRAGELGAARTVYQEILEKEPDNFEALSLLGVLSGQSHDLERAVLYFDRAIAVRPDAAAVYCNRGLALNGLGRHSAALASFERAIALEADNAVAHFSRGNIYRELGHLDEALCSYDRAVAIDPSLAPALVNRAYVLYSLGRFEAALSAYDHAIATSPNDASSYLYRGNALKEINRLDAALASYDQAIAIKSDYAEAYSNRGIVLYTLGRIDAALASYDRAIQIKPDYAEAYFNRASVLRFIRRFEAAAADYETAGRLAPDTRFLSGALLETHMQVCNWSDFDAAVARLSASIERGDPASHPFALLTFVDSPRLQRKAAEIWVRETCPEDAALGEISTRAHPEKIRVGYFSADFREHPLAHLFAELVETHDRSRFELVAFSFGPDTQDPLRKRLAKTFDRFLDVQGQSNSEIASLSRSLPVDIAVDLGGHTHGTRPHIFALRAAPVQVNYLGYPGTLGAGYIDYIVADSTLVPSGREREFSEKIIFLPHTYQVNDTQRSIALETLTREEFGLPPDGFVFCCFNNNYKITPPTFSSWMRILKRVSGSVLWLLEDNASAAKGLRHKAITMGVKPERLIFAPRMAHAEHLARHRRADLFLDTLPYNAHTTASDALWAGLPVLTCIGESFPARVAASLLRAIELPELIASSLEHYEELAIELASNPRRLAHIKRKLADNRLTTPLFDSRLFTRHLEAAYTQIHERSRAKLPPDHVRVTVLPRAPL